MMPRTPAIGIQDFSEIIENKCFYVDKTTFIKEWWENMDKVTLIARPRRFGKTLTMSMLEQFFSVKYAKRSDLFNDLSIWTEEKYRKLQGTYPVIFLSFADIKDKNYRDTHTGICQIITDIYARNYFLLNCGILNESEQRYFLSVADDMADRVAAVSLKRLSEYLYRYYGKKVIILLDEYDTPMQEAYVNGYWDELAAFTRSLFNAAFKTNPYLERAILTGITRISKESIFSDLNNLTVVTTTSKIYENSFGFTEQEVFQALEEYNLTNQKQTVKKWYDGFTFGNQRNIYNPWSIIHYLKYKEFSAYWVHTSSNRLVYKLIQESSSEVKSDFEELLRGHSLVKRLDEQIIFSQLTENESAIWSLLLASGYLNVQHCTSDELSIRRYYHLTLTNEEVRMMFEDMVRDWFAREQKNYNAFIKALLSDNIEAMNHYMNKVALNVFSSFDTGNKPSKDVEPEKFYHGFVLGLIVELSNRYTVLSNRESGFGRYDVMLEPKDRQDIAVIMEFKVFHSQKEKSLEDTVKNALQQIKEKRYAASLEAKGISPDRIREYGFAFQGKTVLIGG